LTFTFYLTNSSQQNWQRLSLGPVPILWKMLHACISLLVDEFSDVLRLWPSVCYRIWSLWRETTGGGIQITTAFRRPRCFASSASGRVPLTSWMTVARTTTTQPFSSPGTVLGLMAFVRYLQVRLTRAACDSAAVMRHVTVVSTVQGVPLHTALPLSRYWISRAMGRSLVQGVLPIAYKSKEKWNTSTP
jgi:hypothetical protein